MSLLRTLRASHGTSISARSLRTRRYASTGKPIMDPMTGELTALPDIQVGNHWFLHLFSVNANE